MKTKLKMNTWQQFYEQNELLVWMAISAIVLTLATSYMVFTSRPSILFPWSLNIGLLKALFPETVVIFLIPSLYLVRLYLRHINKMLEQGLLGKMVFLSAFNFLWIALFIDRALNQHNYWPTLLTTLENIILTAGLFILFFWGKKRHKRWPFYAAHLGLYLMLIWCAFPNFYNAEQYYW